MAVNMNKREPQQTIFLVFLVLHVLFHGAISSTTTPDSTNTTDSTTDSTAPSTTVTTTVPTTTTTTVPTTTTTTIAPLLPPSELDLNSLTSQCPCDLTGNACDVSCCCDEDCTADDKKAFTSCLPFSTDVDDRVCFRKEIILFENSDPIVSEITDDNLFCIYYDNKEERNFYTNPDLVQTLSTFNEYKAEFPVFSFQSDPITTVSFDSPFYKSGDPIYTVLESLAVGKLGLPRTSNTVECVDDNPAGYLLDESHTCTRSIENLTLECEGAVALDANTFINGFRVVTSPQLFQVFNVTVPGTDNYFSLYNNSYTVAVELDNQTTTVDPIQCIFNATSTGPCGYTSLPSPILGTNTCNNVVRQVHYRIMTEGTTGIFKVLVRFVLSDIPVSASSTASFTQTFSSTFEDTSSSGEPFKRSGNPGYAVGEPVLAGTLNQTNIGDTPVDVILINPNRDRYMTVVRASATGDCVTDSDSRMSVVFGQSVRTGCVLRVSATNLTQYCALMQQTIIDTMEFDSIPEVTSSGFRDNNRYVGLYGNSDVTKTGDWVKILYVNQLVPSAPTTGTSACQLTLGMHIQILYANIGALVNPQPKIIGVSFIYDSATAVQIRPTLVGEYNQPIEVTTSVAFIDVSKPAVGYEGEPPIFLAKLPYDFFYPFISGASTPQSVLSSFLPLVLVVLLTVSRVL
ncbi:tectonic-3-like [Littorina saxatilis]|uniref:Tectonic domain-containing protein n=1 Tax=Littorina saxatilis TaxID=31220 RepID=A0AAN9B642_9CAEN